MYKLSVFENSSSDEEHKIILLTKPANPEVLLNHVIVACVITIIVILSFID